MSSQPSNFRRTDFKRTVQAMQAAGLKVARVELHGGKVLIIPANVTPLNTSDPGDGQ
jgi:hypothetical protein